MKKSNIEIITEAVAQLKKKDSILIENRTHERSIAHRLAIYIENIINSPQSEDYWDVDCEYNRDGIGYNAKALMKIKDNANNIGKTIKSIEKTKVYPDIIVHKRGQQVGLIAIELKHFSLDCRYDRIKLAEYKRQLAYKTAALIKYKTCGRGQKDIQITVEEI